MGSVRRKKRCPAVEISGESVCLHISTKRFTGWGADKKARNAASTRTDNVSCLQVDQDQPVVRPGACIHRNGKKARPATSMVWHVASRPKANDVAADGP
ncbi:hypothetical protein HPB50_006487 [Hyalomma asiaticum]|uniref:Uncharacterized protein n=1 Tax=Hyalomma asiaticum TaxID=266040 RepID=A0ACB7SD16_HYAAI|nr:hypothetical protein HPB50_006487 [Hyalomma asiaticum]